MQWLYHSVRHLLVHWGYWAVLIGILGEDAGLPLPGETILMFAAFLCEKGTGLHLLWIILIGIGAAIMGDNLGFFLGRKIGPRLIRWMRGASLVEVESVNVAKDQIRRHGAATVFWARYIVGLRVVAGPLAGVLGMEWRKFLLFNALGAACWVISITLLGYAFANSFQSLLTYFEKASWVMVIGLVTVGYLIWRHEKKLYEQRQQSQDHEQ